MTKQKEKHTYWQHLGFEEDITLYHKGGESHWVEVRSVERGGLLSRKEFRGIDARRRAEAFAANLPRK